MSQKPDIELLFEQGGLKNNRGANMALLLAQATGRSDMLERFTKLATLRAALVAEPHPFPSPETGELPDSGLSLGINVLANNHAGPEVYLPIDALYRHPHILVGGASGTGKSWYLGMHLCVQLIGLEEVIWFFDSEGDFVDLAAVLGPEKLWVLRHDQFRRNPLEPLPGEDPLVALGRLKTVLREATFMRDGSLNLMSELVHKLYTERGVFTGSEDYPCLEDVFQEAKRARWRLDSRRGQYGEVLMSRLGNLLDNMRPTYLCKKGFPITELVAHSIVFDITGLSRDLAHFFVADIVSWVADFKLRSA